MATRAQFEANVMQHLDAAFNLARWLARNDADAEDVVQEAALRAFRYYDFLVAGMGEARCLATRCRQRGSRRVQGQHSAGFPDEAWTPRLESHGHHPVH